MSLPPFDRFAEAVRRRLRQPLPGSEAQLRMALGYRHDADLASVRGKRCREAGVLIALYPLAEEPTLVLTVRRSELRDHAGQVSLPGGRREAEETLAETALREAHEEVNIAPESVELVGALTPLYIPPSRFCVYPQVGILARRPPLHATDAEVARILEVPVRHLMKPSTRRLTPRTLGGAPVDVPSFLVEGHDVWGATAMMLAELLVVIDEAAW
ncbi:MAG: CoA pyrophosphatase [Bacteroidota bacterium]